MPWKKSSAMIERAKFVERLESGERMIDLCTEFGISRKTGYKFVERYNRLGELGLLDQSRRPSSFGRSTSLEVECLIVSLRKEYKTWGAAKIREILIKRHPGLRIPVRSTIHEVLDRNGLVTKRKKSRGKACPTDLRKPMDPNDLWCADFKGQFRLGNGSYCYPLTVTDQVSRYLLCCEGLENTSEDPAQNVFEMTFREYGLPLAIRTDNGCPFSTRGLLGLSKLSVWWMRLGIEIERIKPGHPEQNGRHERMHLTLKQETTRPVGSNFLQQQERFDVFSEIFNKERPHEGLEMKTPGSVYRRSNREFPRVLHDPDYPEHEAICYVNSGGRVNPGFMKNFNLSAILAGQLVGLRQVEEELWQVNFMNLNLGYYDQREETFTSAKEWNQQT